MAIRAHSQKLEHEQRDKQTELMNNFERCETVLKYFNADMTQILSVILCNTSYVEFYIACFLVHSVIILFTA